MARSLGFAAYRALSRRKSNPSATTPTPRPKGKVLWLHATNANRYSTLWELGKRLLSQRDDLVILITGELALTGTPGVMSYLTQGNIQFDSFASDHPGEIGQFLDHWRPDMCLWAGAALMPNLISESAERGIPMFLIDVDQNDFASRKHKWFPDLIRSSLNQFETIMTNDAITASMIQRMGVPAPKITLSEPLRNGPSPLPFAEDDLSEVSDQLTGRPVWLAVHAQNDEIGPILTAHRKALRLLHRLLLVLIVKNSDEIDRQVSKLKATGLRAIHWKIGDTIDQNTQVLISDGSDDLGLWYRTAPLTFMASSLTAGNTGESPLTAVALGSAVLFGPFVRDYKDTYARLVTVGAAQSVGDAGSLGTAVIRLSAPDQAAVMALAGWHVVTEGAELTDQLTDLVHDQLDMGEAHNARP